MAASGPTVSHRSRPLPRSVYAETARPPVPTPALEGERAAAVAVIGGGYTGLSAALHLAESGIPVTVLERHEPGWGASGRNGGQVNPGLYPNPRAVLAEFGEELGTRMLRHASDAPDAVFALVGRHGIDCEAEQTGTLRAAFDAPGATKVEATLGQWREAGLPAEWRDEAALAAATGTRRYRCGMFFPRGGKLNPLGYARGLAEAAIRVGAAIHGDSPALALERAGGGWRVRTPRGTLTADHLVLAANGYTDALWPKLKESVIPVYTTIAATAPLPEELAEKILPGGSVLYEVGNVTVYYRLDRDRRLLIGGRGVMRDAAGLRDAAHLTGYAERLWPFLKGIAWTHVWNGQVAVTVDQNFHFHELGPNVHASLGCNGRGIAMATAMGALLARRVAGEPPEALPMPLSPLRPIRFHALWKPAVAFRLAYWRTRDRLGV